MSTVLDLHDVLGLSPAPAEPADHAPHDDGGGDGGGFVDCRGVRHLWTEDDV